MKSFLTAIKSQWNPFSNQSQMKSHESLHIETHERISIETHKYPTKQAIKHPYWTSQKPPLNIPSKHHSSNSTSCKYLP